MITIFSNPRPFTSPFDIIQRNAIKSWLKLSPKCKILLFEDEEKTTSKVANEFGIQCIADVKCDEFGTPLLDDVFDKVQKIAKGGVIAQVNADIILMNSFTEAIERVLKIIRDRPFFMTGRRWDLDIKEFVNFEESDWWKKLMESARKEGKLHGFSGMDYWVLSFKFPFEILPFIIGRPGMDSWLVHKSRSFKMPVIDSTAVVDIIHQNHNYPKKKLFLEVEKKRNLELAGGFANMCTLRDADWILTRKGLKRPPFPRRIFAELALFYPWRLILSLKRKIQQFLS